MNDEQDISRYSDVDPEDLGMVDVRDYGDSVAVVMGNNDGSPTAAIRLYPKDAYTLARMITSVAIMVEDRQGDATA